MFQADCLPRANVCVKGYFRSVGGEFAKNRRAKGLSLVCGDEIFEVVKDI